MLPAKFAFDYAHAQVGKALIVHADCFEWMGRAPEASIHGIVTDPPSCSGGSGSTRAAMWKAKDNSPANF